MKKEYELVDILKMKRNINAKQIGIYFLINNNEIENKRFNAECVIFNNKLFIK